MDINKYFPYKEIRPQQKRVIEQIAKEWNNKKYFILQLDVGTGKSGIAKCMCNYAANSFIITSTKQLQDQYKNDFAHESNMTEIKGKNNYACLRSSNLTCDLGPCTLSGKKCKFINDCLYFKQRNAAIRSPICLTSYAYALRGIHQNTLWNKRELIVFDEAHLLESELVNMTQFTIDTKYLDEKFNIFDDLSNDDYAKIVKVIKSTEDYEFYLENTLECVSKEIIRLEALLKEKGIDAIDNYKETAKKNDYLTLLRDKILCFKYTYTSDLDWMIGVTAEGCLHFTPLKVKNLFKYFCDTWATKFIFMSATILDIDGYIEQLGVDPAQCCVIKEASEFDPKKSPIYFMPCGSMSYSTMDETLPKEAGIIDQILTAHNTEKGIIHTGNYKVAKYLFDKHYNSRYIYNTDGKTNNQVLIDKHTKTYKPTVLLSPSMTTGVDLRDDLSRWQVVMKLPYKSLADERVKKMSEIDPKWYACDVLRSLVQACGRSTRSAEDSSKTYILDSGFSRLVKTYRAWLPTSFLDRIIGLD